MEQVWEPKGGIAAYASHVKEVAAKFDHVDLHPDVWIENVPTSCNTCHQFLKAIQVLESQMLFAPSVEAAAWACRLAFFRDLKRISEVSVLLDIAEDLGLPVDKIKTLMENGEALAALDMDQQLREKHRIGGSPSLLFNEERQMIFGNVWYRVIEANKEELLANHEDQVSWC